MSSGSPTKVDVSMCGAGATLKVGCMNESGSATPPCYAPVQRGNIFRGMLQLSSLFTDFSLYSVMLAIDGTVGTAWGPLSQFSLHIVLWG